MGAHGKDRFWLSRGGDKNEFNSFYLRVEEYRTFEGLSGTKKVEFRWRNPTLAETKQIANRNNARIYPPMQTAISEIKTSSIVPDPDLFALESSSDLTGPH